MPLEFDIADLQPAHDEYATRLVDRLLTFAIERSASDLHLTQTADGIDVRMRVAGQLLEFPRLSDGQSTSVFARLKALARLITYRNDVPQEGRLLFQRSQQANAPVEARVATIPTLHGERIAIRLSLATHQQWQLADLGLPEMVLSRLTHMLQATSGVILLTGAAGTGKTTTGYACLRAVLAQPASRSTLSLEDPVECEIHGIAQSQIDVAAGYDWKAGLKALLRQDPEVMFVGEIRDADTAAIVFQAAMTGQLVITTMHARSCIDALRRLLDMGVPYQHLRSVLSFLSCQELLSKICSACQDEESAAGIQLRSTLGNDSCPDNRCSLCRGSGVSGRQVYVELLPEIESGLAKAIAQDCDMAQLGQAAKELGMTTLTELTQQAVAEGKLYAGTGGIMPHHGLEATDIEKPSA